MSTSPRQHEPLNSPSPEDLTIRIRARVHNLRNVNLDIPQPVGRDYGAQRFGQEQSGV